MLPAGIFNGVSSSVLYPPIHCPERFSCREFGDEIVYVARTEYHKRQHLLIEAMRYTTTPVRLRLCGTAASRGYVDRLRYLIDNFGLADRVILEDRWVTEDEKIRACRLTEAAGGDFVKTSTGFAPSGATLDDLRLMRAHTSPHVQVKAAGGVRTLDALLEVMAVGVTRCGATATAAMLDDFKARKAGAVPASAGSGLAGGY